MAEEPIVCNHKGCEKTMPKGDDVADGWTSARIEEHQKKRTVSYWAYCCPSHTFTTAPKQQSLF